jgi:hypothetical protein
MYLIEELIELRRRFVKRLLDAGLGRSQQNEENDRKLVSLIGIITRRLERHPLADLDRQNLPLGKRGERRPASHR